MDHPPSLFGENNDFGAEFGFGEDFAASFGFGADFGACFGDFGDLFEGSITTIEYDNFSYDSSADDVEFSGGVGRWGWRRRWRRRPNRLFRIESVKSSCWYRRFTQPG